MHKYLYTQPHKYLYAQPYDMYQNLQHKHLFINFFEAKELAQLLDKSISREVNFKFMNLKSDSNKQQKTWATNSTMIYSQKS